MDMEWMKNKPPPVSIEDRTIVGPVDRGLNNTIHSRKQEVVETGKLII